MSDDSLLRVTEAINIVIGELPEKWRDVANRLAADPNMEQRVWHKLLANERVDRWRCDWLTVVAYRLDQWADASKNLSDAEVGCVVYLIEAARIFSEPLLVKTRREADEMAARYQNAAECCAEAAGIGQGVAYATSSEDLQTLERASILMARFADSMRSPAFLVLPRASGKPGADDQTRVRIVTLAEGASRIFGGVELSTGVIRTTAVAATGRAVDYNDVERWLRSYYDKSSR